MVSAQQKKEFIRGMTKGAGALGVGVATKLVLKVASGKQPTLSLEAVNPAAGAGGLLGFAALVGGLAISGNAEAGIYKDHKHSTLRKIVGYGILAAVGASLDPDVVPRQLTRDPGVAAQYANWIPQYAPEITFVGVRPTPPFAVVKDVYTEVPRFPNVF